MLDYYKARFVCALRKLYSQHHHTQLGLSVQSKPSKALFASKECKAGSLVLVPFSTNISVNIIKSPTKGTSSVFSELLGHLRTDDEDKVVDLSQFTGKPIAATLLPRMQLASGGEGKKFKDQFIVPFWAAKVCPDSKDASLVMKVYTANDIGIRCLVNDKKIKDGDELQMSDATKKELGVAPMDTLKRKAKKDPNNAAKRQK